MTLVRNSAESGLANGTAVTTANSAFTDAFSDVVPGTGTIQYTTANFFKGTRGIKFAGTALANGTTAPNCYVSWLNVAGATSAATSRFYLFVTALPTDGRTRLGTYLTSAGVGQGSLAITTTGTLRIATDISSNDLATTTGTLSLNTWYRVEWTQTTGTSTTGTSTLRVYTGDSNTAIANMSLDVTASDFGTATTGGFRLGQNNFQTGGAFYVVDDIAFQTGSSALLGPSGVNIAPTANAGTSQVNIEPWTTVTLTGTDSDADGTVVSRAWAQTSGTSVTLAGATTATATFTAPPTIAGSVLGFSYTVTDNGAATGTASTSVTVLPVTERAVIGGAEVPMQIRVS